MAFFGITKLGPQNSFQDSLKKASVITCFASAEFESAYARVATRRGCDTLTADAVPAILEVVYHGPAPETDLLRVQHKLASCGEGDPLPLVDFLAAVDAAKAEEEGWEATQKNIVSGGSEFASSKFYRDHITRHTRMDRNPNEKYNQPLTANMEIGWTPPDCYTAPRAAKKSCEETVYAAELIKAGVYY